MTKDDEVYLRHILDAIIHIERYAKEAKDYEKFSKNDMAHDAVIRQLEIIGEAAKRISSECKAQASEIPWVDVTGMRDKLIHEYFGVDLSAVWKTINEDVPPLKAAMERIMASS